MQRNFEVSEKDWLHHSSKVLFIVFIKLKNYKSVDERKSHACQGSK